MAGTTRSNERRNASAVRVGGSRISKTVTDNARIVFYHAECAYNDSRDREEKIQVLTGPKDDKFVWRI
jgi:hypothetical protein